MKSNSQEKILCLHFSGKTMATKYGLGSVEALFEVLIGPQIHHKQRLEWTKAKKGGDGQQNNNSKHIELPGDVIELIIATFVKRFSMRHAIRLSIVCKHWLNVVSLETPDEPPWITVTEASLDCGERDQYISCLNLWGNEGSMDQATYRLPGATMAMTRAASCGHRFILASSQGGWLVFGCYCHSYPRRVSPSVDEHPLSLYNPFSKIYFDLPMYSPPIWTCCRHGGEGLKVFSVFSYNLYPGDYFVVLSRTCTLSLSRLDGQGKWFYYHNRRHFPYCDLLFQQEEQCLYASDKGGVDIFTVECDYESECGSSQVFRLNAVSFVQITSNLLDDTHFSTHLVKFCGYILVVSKADKANSPVDPDCNVEVYKFGNKDKCVSRIHSIGDHALFLANAGSASFCVSARDFPKVQQNCIYLHNYHLRCVATISLEDGAINLTRYLSMGLLFYRLFAIDSRFIAPPSLNPHHI